MSASRVCTRWRVSGSGPNFWESLEPCHPQTTTSLVCTSRPLFLDIALPSDRSHGPEQEVSCSFFASSEGMCFFFSVLFFMHVFASDFRRERERESLERGKGPEAADADAMHMRVSHGSSMKACNCTVNETRATMTHPRRKILGARIIEAEAWAANISARRVTDLAPLPSSIWPSFLEPRETRPLFTLADFFPRFPNILEYFRFLLYRQKTSTNNFWVTAINKLPHHPTSSLLDFPRYSLHLLVDS